jgi:uncharacterized protein (DUF302 family)
MRFIPWFLVAVLALAAHAAASEPIDRRSDRSFAETLQQLHWALGGYGMTVVAALDHQQAVKALRALTGPARILEVSRREWLKTLLSEDPALGMVLPVRLYVFESADGTTVVSYVHIGPQLVQHPSEAARRMAEEIDQKIDAVVIQATVKSVAR